MLEKYLVVISVIFGVSCWKGNSEDGVMDVGIIVIGPHCT
jgi:hypothetical protein